MLLGQNQVCERWADVWRLTVSALLQRAAENFILVLWRLPINASLVGRSACHVRAFADPEMVTAILND